MNPIDALINPRAWFPFLRRKETVAVQPYWTSLRSGSLVQRTRTPAEVMSFCKAFFPDEKALFHAMRIERKIERSRAILAGKFELSNFREIRPRALGAELFPRFFQGIF